MCNCRTLYSSVVTKVATLNHNTAVHQVKDSTITDSQVIIECTVSDNSITIVMNYYHTAIVCRILDKGAIVSTYVYVWWYDHHPRAAIWRAHVFISSVCLASSTTTSTWQSCVQWRSWSFCRENKGSVVNPNQPNKDRSRIKRDSTLEQRLRAPGYSK